MNLRQIPKFFASAPEGSFRPPNKKMAGDAALLTPSYLLPYLIYIFFPSPYKYLYCPGVIFSELLNLLVKLDRLAYPASWTIWAICLSV